MQKSADSLVRDGADFATKDRWDALWSRLGAKTTMDYAYALLMDAYSDRARAYHNVGHISNCINELNGARGLFKNPDAAELALWFHDIVYDTKRSDNEERSAQLAFETITKVGLKAELAKEVKALILATKHDRQQQDGDARLLTDIDLAILGYPRKAFDEYELGVRKEYGWVPQNDFAAGRAAILRGFLSRQSIYSTDFFRNKYETAARGNIERSLAALK